MKRIFRFAAAWLVASLIQGAPALLAQDDADPVNPSMAVSEPAVGEMAAPATEQYHAPGCPDCSGEFGVKFFRGVNGCTCGTKLAEPTWHHDERLIPWEAFAYGEYVGPYRTPHVPVYRLRVDDQIEFVYRITREQTFQAYRLMVGDTIRIDSSTVEELNQGGDSGLTILSDGSISLRLIGRVMAARKTVQELQDELNERYAKYFETDPTIVVTGVTTDTHIQDLINAVDARFGAGGQGRLATVSPDGTVQLPMIGSVPAIGMTLEELGREVNMRYRQHIQGIEVTPILQQRAPRAIFVLGEVAQPGRYELNGPTSAMQALSLAGGWNPGGNLRQIVVFRRDHDWQLMAIRLDLSGGLWGHRPMPSDEIWLRDSDLVLVPKMPIQRVADAVNLYFTQGLYGVFPAQFGLFDGQAIFR
jgi:polysaccharide export outer membrane protein